MSLLPAREAELKIQHLIHRCAKLESTFNVPMTCGEDNHSAIYRAAKVHGLNFLRKFYLSQSDAELSNSTMYEELKDYVHKKLNPPDPFNDPYFIPAKVFPAKLPSKAKMTPLFPPKVEEWRLLEKKRRESPMATSPSPEYSSPTRRMHAETNMKTEEDSPKSSPKEGLLSLGLPFKVITGTHVRYNRTGLATAVVTLKPFNTPVVGSKRPDVYPLRPRIASFVSRLRPRITSSEDIWFRPVMCIRFVWTCIRRIDFGQRLTKHLSLNLNSFVFSLVRP
ncbi:hypothetical protein Fmac_025073 [Flemingia macrophylla]|uniref:Uncharacterized protein n=1 Tax=Flemingia macrophylla TaxID=520843 RepID=A0ABD1LSX6_9FABA